MPEDAIVEVEDAVEDEAPRVESCRTVEVQLIVDEGGQQVVRARHGMNVTGEVQVDTLGRDDLGTPSTGATAFCTTDRTEGRLTQRTRRPHPESTRGLRQPDHAGRLAFTSRRGSECRHEHEPAAERLVSKRRLWGDFRRAWTPMEKLRRRHTDVGGYLFKCAHPAGLCGYSLGSGTCTG